MELGAASVILLSLCGLGVAYLIGAVFAVRRFSARAPETVHATPPVTVLKPLCGAEPELYENLRSFCEQDYPRYQIVFGVLDADDPAVAVVRRLIDEFPELDLTLVADSRSEGSNLKVATLEHVLDRADHDLLVIADSDIRVGPDYLSRIVQPLKEPEVGLVTCAFTARSAGGSWSRLRSMWFNYDFLPSVLVSRRIGLQIGCFGSTMALRGELLRHVGGLESLRDQLADDYALGVAVRRSGKRVVLSSYVVRSTISEPSFGSLILHELRWGRTLRSMAPLGYAGTVVTHPFVLALGLVAWTGFNWPALSMLGLALTFRLWLAREIARAWNLRPASLWLVPLRDMLSFVTFVASLWGSRVVWRQRHLRVASGGRLVTEQRSP
jgi:ceramide glucosyltransferase